MSFVQQQIRHASMHSLVDEEILMLIRNGNTLAIDYLMNKYKYIVHKKASAYFLIGSEREDIIQEGLIGLYNAIYRYDPVHQTSFKTFAEICISRQMISAIKMMTRKKHQPLNSYISLYKTVYDEDSERQLVDIIVDEGALDPKEYVVLKEQIKTIKYYILEALTKLERDVLSLYVEGYSYKEMAVKLKRPEKSIDNAMQRIKMKVANYVQGNV